MGGKQKQAQRTKGNVRPSSSARAAEMLSASGVTGAGFVGFGALSGDLGYVPVNVQGSEEVDSSVDADFRLSLRKLSKRDPTTKLKALQEFTALCKEKDIDAVKSVLPFWPRIYAKLAIDNDRRIRESTQQCFEQLVLRVRRNLAPHLKSLMGPWLLSQCDVYAPAASAARVTFQAAFPPAKQADALVYCGEEILDYLQDNLFTQTAQTLSDPKTSDPEDMESKYLKVLTASLSALRLFMTTVPSDHQGAFVDRYRTVLSDPKLWKLNKHKSNMVRAAHYSLLGGVCQTQPELANEMADKLCPLVLHHLDESDPIICPALWETVLYTLTTVDNCWEKVNARKGVLPTLWALLKNGCHGNATVVCPNLLPFLSQVPSSVIGEGTAFYLEFFGNLKTGLSKEKVIQSPSEYSAIVKALVECLRYVLFNHLEEQHDSQEVVDLLLQDHLLPMLEASVVDKASNLATSPLYHLTAEMLVSLQKLRTSDDNSRQAGADRVAKAIWDGISHMTTTYVDSTIESSAYILSRLASLLESFKVPIASTKKKSSGVRFTEETFEKKLELEMEENPKMKEMEKLDGSILLSNSGPVIEVVGKASAQSYGKTRHLESTAHLSFLARLCRTYMCATLADKILDTVDGEDSDEDADLSDISDTFIKGILLPWFKAYDEISSEASKKKDIANDLCQITYSVYSADFNKDKASVLSHIVQEVSSPSLLQVLVNRALPVPRDPAVTRWFKGAEFGQKMVGVAKSLCCQSLAEGGGAGAEPDLETDACWGLLTVALSADQNLEPILGSQYIEAIVEEIRLALPSPSQLGADQNDRVEKCVSFVCDVALQFFSNLHGCLLIPSSEELLLALFQLSCESNIALSELVLDKVNRAWQQGVKALLHQRGGLVTDDGFFSKVIDHLRSKVNSDADTVDRLKKLSSITVRLGQCIADNVPCADGALTGDLSHPTVQQVYKHLTGPLMAAATGASVPQWNSSTLVSGELPFAACPSKMTSLNTTAIPKCVVPTAFTSQLLVACASSKTVARATVTIATPTEEAECEADLDTVQELAHCVALCIALMGKRRKALQNSELGKVTSLLLDNLVFLLDDMDKADVQKLVSQAIQRSLAEGDLRALTLKVLLAETNKLRMHLSVIYLLGSMDSFDQPTVQSLQTLQVLLPHLPRTELLQSLEVRAAQVISCPFKAISDITGGQGFVAVISGILEQQEVPVTDDSSFSTQAMLEVLAELQRWRDQHESLLAFGSVVKSLDWRVVSFNLQVMHLLRALVVKMPSKLSSENWDLVLCSLTSWVQTCHESRADLATCIATQAFAVQVCNLLTAVSLCMQKVVPEQKDSFPENIDTEWNEFFSEGIYTLLLPLFASLAETETTPTDCSSTKEVLLCSMGRAISLCPLTHAKAHKLPPRLRADDEGHLDDNIQTLLNHLCPLLLSQTRAVQLTAYKLLKLLMPELPQYDEGASKDDEDKDEPSRSPPVALMSVLETSSHALEVILQDLKVDETMIIEPYIQEHSLAVAYLFSWRLILAFFRGASSELRAQYAAHLRHSNAVDTLLRHVFRLMPESPTVQLTDSLTAQSPLQRLSSSKNMFAEEPLLDVMEDSSSLELQHLACAVYKQALRDLPAILRQWWTNQEKRTASTVERFTSKYVSPVLCAQELAAIQNKDITLDNMVIKARSATREVVATYNVDEVSMELVVMLPANHPLGTMTVESGKRIGVANTQWRNWMLQMTTFLSHQNGSIVDGLSLWKRNVDKRFSGVEECMICFSVIHGSTYQLPKLQCRTCKKKYHSACLYKWFSTSNKSTCPLCRNLF